MKTIAQEKTLHTPTPWSFTKNSVITKIFSEGHAGIRVAGVHIANLAENDKANAAFIVRAANSFEELLTVLKVTLKLARDGYSPDKDLLAKAISRAESPR